MATPIADVMQERTITPGIPTPAKMDAEALESFMQAAQELQASEDTLSAVEEHETPTVARPSLRTGTSTPPPRRSIQFAREDELHDARSNPTSDDRLSETPNNDLVGAQRQRERLKSRMKSFGLQTKPPGHTRTRSSIAMGASENGYATSPAIDGAYTADEDGEMGDSSLPPSPAPFTFSKKKRKIPQTRPEWFTDTEPGTPMDDAFHTRRAAQSESPARRGRPAPMRRATMNDVTEGQKEGVSEDEGRARLPETPGKKRRSSAWIQSASGQSFMRNRKVSRQDDPADRSAQKRLRRSGTDNEETPTRLKMTEAREKWKKLAPKVRTAMRMRAKREKVKQIDIEKSAELMAELLAGSPAAIIAASYFQPDELRKKKTPVLLEQLKISIPSSDNDHTSTDKHAKFNINLEYGNGLMRMEWTISRYLTDFVNLHAKYYAAQLKTDFRRGGLTSNRKNKPHFPRGSFPQLKNMVGAAVLPEEEDEEKAPGGEESGTEGPAPTLGRLDESHTRRGSSQHLRSYSSGAIRGLGKFPGRSNTGELEKRKEDFPARQRRKLETYLREMIRYYMFRGGSNRLCRFLEISALGVHLAAEGGYHGKEGMLHIKKSGKLKGITQSTWFLVRESFVACVNSPEETALSDLFLVDSEFNFQSKLPRIRDQKTAKDMAKTAKANTGKSGGHRLKLWNKERTLTLYAKNERQQEQFAQSIHKMWNLTPWANPQRFDSFAPIRHDVHAEWLVEARDYMWKLSRAVDNAENVVYIHDWWLSPELYLRRPPGVSRKWRLDRLLKRKAEQGVKIFIIMYRNINSAIPIDSEYTKHTLLDLHPNIHVQRSPNQVFQTTLYWAHHEKICVVDNIIAFCGGVDLCFGRWDTPDHALSDDKGNGRGSGGHAEDADDCQVWPGKDYSNPRVQDFFNLHEPYAEMYNRNKTPRMPWHDIGMQVLGQPARDLARHFVQRWNYLLRERKAGARRGPSRPMPTLLPPADFRPQEIEALQLNGTCEVQILRSCGEWSNGTPDRLEKSIQNAYLKLIEQSDHFVYIENQFFVSSCWFEGTEMKNKIGDALVERIIRAHENDEDWAAVILIPLMPGFQNSVDEQDGSSIRLIMECQYRSICRGESSIFGKLKAAGVDPTEYIQFYSLRQWGKIGSTKALTTEQLYIHAKCMIVDDRSVIIGSANINERSMNGDHDSEVAAVIRDKTFIDSTMAGQPYKVAKFAHSLRLRLMREHLGLDVDGMRTGEVEGWSTSEAYHQLSKTLRHGGKADDVLEAFAGPGDAQIDEVPDTRQSSQTRGVQQDSSSEELTGDTSNQYETFVERGRDSRILESGREVLVSTGISEGKGTVTRPRHSTVSSRTWRDDTSFVAMNPSWETVALPPPMPPRMHTHELGLPQLSQLPQLPATDDSDIGGPPLKTFTQISATSLNAFISEISRPVVEEDCMKDPITDSFLLETWHKVAENNTKLYRQVFRCMPDNEVQTWAQYKAFNTYANRFNEAQGISHAKERVNTPNTPSKTGPPGTGAEDVVKAKLSTLNNSSLSDTLSEKRTAETERVRSDTALSTTPPSILRLHTVESHGQSDGATDQLSEKQDIAEEDARKNVEFGTLPSKEDAGHVDSPDEKKELHNQATLNPGGSTRRRRRATTKSSNLLRSTDPIMAKEDAEEVLKLVQGNLVVFPYDWLDKENWFFNVDRMAPLDIYD